MYAHNLLRVITRFNSKALAGIVIPHIMSLNVNARIDMYASYYCLKLIIYIEGEEHLLYLHLLYSMAYFCM